MEAREKRQFLFQTKDYNKIKAIPVEYPKQLEGNPGLEERKRAEKEES